VRAVRHLILGRHDHNHHLTWPQVPKGWLNLPSVSKAEGLVGSSTMPGCLSFGCQRLGIFRTVGPSRSHRIDLPAKIARIR
jgi:hypothetical protein